MISFVLFPKASVPSLNFSKSFSGDFVSKNISADTGLHNKLALQKG